MISTIVMVILMARTKKYYNIMDVNATKSRDIHFRVTQRELIDLDKLRHKTNLSKSDIIREALKDYYNKVFLEE